MAGEAPDRLDGVPHPRETYTLVGQEAAERRLFEAATHGRLHHAWLLSGPEGIGKATLAYRFARHLLDPGARKPDSTDLFVPPQSAVSRKIEAQGHPNILAVTRGLTADRKSLAAEIRVDEIRRVGSFLASTAGADGWRIVIIDKADEMNVNSANALLKVLEEPPERSIFLLVCERPQRLPATLRSRCRTLALRPLPATDVLAVIAGLHPGDRPGRASLAKAADAGGGSVRRALQLLQHDEAIAAPLGRMLRGLPSLDRRADLELADLVAAGGAEAAKAFAAGVLDHAHAQATGEGGGDRERLARWSEVWENVATAARTADVFNLDRRPFVLSTLAMLAAAAR